MSIYASFAQKKGLDARPTVKKCLLVLVLREATAGCVHWLLLLLTGFSKNDPEEGEPASYTTSNIFTVK